MVWLVSIWNIPLPKLFLMYKQEAEGLFLNQNKFRSNHKISCKAQSPIQRLNASFFLIPFSAAPSIVR